MRNRTPEYRSWEHMKARCRNENHIKYPAYGGRGISYCKRWEQFDNFLADMGPSCGGTIDRIDNDGDYTPENCRWATNTEQLRNTRKNRLLTMNGITQCLSAWAEETGIHRKTISERIRMGWTVAKALTHPVQKRAA